MPRSSPVRHLGYNWQLPTNLVFGVEGDVASWMGSIISPPYGDALGYAFGKTLVYATGGAAFIGFSNDFGGDNSDTGWVAGAGIERKLRENMSIGVEGLYYGFDDNNNIGSSDENFWAARARLTYHLNGDRAPLK